MELAALVDSPDHVCCRYRLRAFEPALTAAGHALRLAPLPRGWWERWGIGRDLEDCDAVILQRRLLGPVEGKLLRRRVKRLLFDFDDAVWLRDSYSRKGFHDPRRSRRLQNLLPHCDAVVAGNAFLAEYARNWVRGNEVHIIPTCVDVNRYPLAEHSRPRGAADLVWIGSSSTLQGLERIAPLIEQVGIKCPDVGLKQICDRFLTLRHMKTIPVRWNESTETADIAAADIGICWVPDDLWSRGKCGLKVLQYMAAGLPVVANPVGVQATMVRHGVTGFLARTEQEWVDAVRTLAHDPALRRQMGAAGRRTVEENYSVETGAERWLSLLDRLQSRRAAA